jgi:hypothetical protein
VGGTSVIATYCPEYVAMTATAIVGRILPLKVAAGGIAYFVSIAGAPGWAVGSARARWGSAMPS